LPKKVTVKNESENSDYINISNYTYDNMNRLTNLNIKINSDRLELSSEYKISYEGNGDNSKVVKLERTGNLNYNDPESVSNDQNDVPESLMLTFTYETDKIIATDSNGKTSTITVDSEGKVLTYTYLSWSGDLTFTNTYTYDNKGNLTEISGIDENGGNPSIFTYKYDSSKGVYRSVNTPQWLMALFVNTDMRYSYINNVAENNGFVWTYTYDNNGYPVSRIMDYQGMTDIGWDPSPTSIEYIRVTE